MWQIGHLQAGVRPGCTLSSNPLNYNLWSVSLSHLLWVVGMCPQFFYAYKARDPGAQMISLFGIIPQGLHHLIDLV